MNDLDGLEITKQVGLFRTFLNKSWDTLDELMNEHDWEHDGGFSDDWVQANWEFLVEREITENKGKISSLSMVSPDDRITTPNAKHEYLVLAKPNNGQKIFDLFENREIDFSKEMRLFGFCKALNPGYGLYPPFDFCYLCDDEKKLWYVTPIDQLSIYLKKVTD